MSADAKHEITPGAVRLVAEKLREEIGFYLEDPRPTESAPAYAVRFATLGELLTMMILDCETEREGDITP